ncbi:hypothetical protein N476_04215 [Pseudoalteromonas luteoviolacea H33]|uniref:Uncharacterized protein n=1 Tax=Pseudoalteromonas luteoviolacea H33 TaxID=1365251 RepID=A0A167ACD1_9GAMM|nr:hypothetical protein N476_04215 [Pseudoalteromonas luteoviolacea H33]KZN70916.1 hypothetical protein N477_05825 [Pseudoalteromonas luteoviolacea H33-S]
MNAFLPLEHSKISKKGWFLKCGKVIFEHAKKL